MCMPYVLALSPFPVCNMEAGNEALIPYSTILYYTLPYSTILYILYHTLTILYHTQPYSTILHHTLYTILHYHKSYIERQLKPCAPVESIIDARSTNNLLSQNTYIRTFCFSLAVKLKQDVYTRGNFFKL